MREHITCLDHRIVRPCTAFRPEKDCLRIYLKPAVQRGFEIFFFWPRDSAGQRGRPKALSDPQWDNCDWTMIHLNYSILYLRTGSAPASTTTRLLRTLRRPHRPARTPRRRRVVSAARGGGDHLGRERVAPAAGDSEVTPPRRGVAGQRWASWVLAASTCGG